MSLQSLKQEYAHAIYCHNEFGGLYKDYLRKISFVLGAQGYENMPLILEFEALRKRDQDTPRARWKIRYRAARLKNKTEILDPFFIDHTYVNGVHLVIMGEPLVIEQGSKTAPKWSQHRIGFYYLHEHLINKRFKRKARWIFELRRELRALQEQGFHLP